MKLHLGKFLLIFTIFLFNLLILPAKTYAVDPCNPIINPIACENSKPGNLRSEWDITRHVNGTVTTWGDPSIEGFATQISVNVGEKVDFKIHTNATLYRIDIYRLGYYQGNGARLITTLHPDPSIANANHSLACTKDLSVKLVDCGNWQVSASWQTPADTVSGVYLAKLVREDGTSGDNHIPFVIRNDGANADVLVQTSDSTWQAYNFYGGNNLYAEAGDNTADPMKRAYKVSYNRPIITRNTNWFSNLLGPEYSTIRFLERNGYNISYFSDVDSDKRALELKNHKILVSNGHDEYWSKGQRDNITAARDAGVNLAFFTGNENYWETRWENSIDGTNSDHRTLVCYKETYLEKKIDPAQVWTGTWRDPLFRDKYGNLPENNLGGTMFTFVNWDSNDATASANITSDFSKFRIFRNTSAASLQSGQSINLTPALLYYEWNEDIDNGFRPTGLIRMSATPKTTPTGYVIDNGVSYGAGSGNHAFTLYRAPSGALVFSAAAAMWGVTLDPAKIKDQDTWITQPVGIEQQMVVNLFADMGVQPATLMTPLVQTTKSTDTIAPSVAITSPANNATVVKKLVIKGTASDSGGVVGGVEVSLDNGVSWHPAQGRENWSYTFNLTGLAAKTFTIKARATDDSGNISFATGPVTVTVTSPRVNDFNLDGKSDLAVFRPSNGGWLIQGLALGYWGTNGWVPVQGDYDGDGRTDMASWNPYNGGWYIPVQPSGPGGLTVNWGAAGWVPVPADYNGDGKTDVAVWNPSNGGWYIPALSPTVVGGLTANWGAQGWIPVPADYNGDGKTDLGVWNPVDHKWYILYYGVSTFISPAWGTNGWVPVPGDYDGDGKADLGMWNPADGNWYILYPGVRTEIIQWGLNGDIPVPADYNGNGKTDLAVFRPSNGMWYISTTSPGGTQMGASGDVPLSAILPIRDFNSDGKIDSTDVNLYYSGNR